jgi:hypothetical protein
MSKFTSLMMLNQSFMKNQFVGLHSDFIGFSASLLCALHCAALPFLLTMAPLAGIQFLGNPWVEKSMILLSFGIACYALVPGYRLHRKPLALILVALGLSCIGFAHTVAPEDFEAVFTPIGGGLIAVAHLINWKQTRQVRAACTSFNSSKNAKQHA